MPSLLDVVRNDTDFLDFVETIFTQGDRATRSKGEPYDQLWLASTQPGPTVKRRMAEVALGDGGGGGAGTSDGATTPDSDVERQPGGEPKSKKSNRPNQSQRKRAAAAKLAAADAAKGAAAHAKCRKRLRCSRCCSARA